MLLAANDCNGMSSKCKQSSQRSLQMYEMQDGRARLVEGVFENVSATQLGPYRVLVTDWDMDGDEDILIAAADGRLHYHEMVEGSWYAEEAVHPFSHINVNKSKEPILLLDWDVFASQRYADVGVISQPVTVDWDNDGDMDLVLGPSGRFFEQRDPGVLVEWPSETSPFSNLSAADRMWRWALPEPQDEADRVWRFIDCDNDAQLCLVWFSGPFVRKDSRCSFVTVPSKCVILIY